VGGLSVETYAIVSDYLDPVALPWADGNSSTLSLPKYCLIFLKYTNIYLMALL